MKKRWSGILVCENLWRWNIKKKRIEREWRFMLWEKDFLRFWWWRKTREKLCSSWPNETFLLAFSRLVKKHCTVDTHFSFAEFTFQFQFMFKISTLFLFFLTRDATTENFPSCWIFFDDDDFPQRFSFLPVSSDTLIISLDD